MVRLCPRDWKDSNNKEEKFVCAAWSTGLWKKYSVRKLHFRVEMLAGRSL